MDRIKESDWKLFRDLSEVALERAFESGAMRIQQLSSEQGKTNRERYWNAVEFGDRYRKELADMFDGDSRSNALFHLAAIVSHDLLKAEELGRFSPEARDFVRGLLEVSRR